MAMLLKSLKSLKSLKGPHVGQVPSQIPLSFPAPHRVIIPLLFAHNILRFILT